MGKENETKGNNYAYISIVAIVAIVAVLVLMSGGSKTTTVTPSFSSDDLVGEAVRTGNTNINDRYINAHSCAADETCEMYSAIIKGSLQQISSSIWEENVYIDEGISVKTGRTDDVSELNIKKDRININSRANSGGGVSNFISFTNHYSNNTIADSWSIGITPRTVYGSPWWGRFYISEGGESRFTIQDGTGNIGIGTNYPQDKLHVEGNVLISDLSGNGTAYVCVNSQGQLFRSHSPCN